jgi:hypothetical protein
LPQAFGRFQADTVNEIWTGDLMNGPEASRHGHLPAGIIEAETASVLKSSSRLRRGKRASAMRRARRRAERSSSSAARTSAR